MREQMTAELYDELKYSFRSKWPPKRRRYYDSEGYDQYGYKNAFCQAMDALEMSLHEWDPDICDR